MSRNYLLLLLLLVSIVQLQMLSIQRGEFRVHQFQETVNINMDDISEIEISDFEGNYVSSKNEIIIGNFIKYMETFQYKRLVNDETSYMPLKTRMIYLHDKNTSTFIIPYGNEVMIDHKIYVVKDGPIENDYLENIFISIKESEK